ncbi:BOI-related E3 ubiquitin-protein ligase 1-like [Juglans microcarpa x Juglans regia]|uniref:BOI-related E3 ubiquitin-protein ligase 1-like n=1 Tax=Juglans microcarpa x Juglans regia TaxID=2249226 RepID=UPI001B7DCCF7|nr:BOI-related E3 ubiquitin-protein ligase 1-like [Juglans microcarpa x Juglans regia]
MAVEARHMYRFPSQSLTNRGFIKPNQGNAVIYSAQMYSGLPLAGTMPEALPPFTQSVDYNLGSAKTFINKADSGLSYSIPDHRKRPTDSINELSALTVPQKRTKLSGLPSFVDRDIIFQAQQQQQGEIDCFFAQYAEKLSSKLEEQKRMLVSAFQENFTKKLKEKEEEIQRMGKLNWVLQERVESLWVENQIWRDLAQTNEAMANSLRNDLEQVLAHVSKDSDAESSCGSNDMGGQCGVADEGGEEAETMKDKAVIGGVGDRMCRQCGVRESRVLLLLCRHLCLCTTCGSNLRSCPVCHSVINASVHVDFS